MQPLSSFTLADPKVMQNPYPYYEGLRAEDPVHFDDDRRRCYGCFRLIT
jgi:hypothetical protein